MSAVLAFERRCDTAELIGEIFRSFGHRVFLSEPIGINPTARLVAEIKPAVVTTCWQKKSDQYTLIGVRRASRTVPIWIISEGEGEEEIAEAVTDAQLIIPQRYPELLKRIILRELGTGTDA